MTSPDLADFMALARPKRKPCAIGVAIDQLDKKAAAQLQAACDADPGVINTGAILQWLKARDHKASIPGVTAHRQRACTCYAD